MAVIAFVLFGRLAVRHVGESYFLADQVDQFQKFEALLRLEPEGLLGGAMSGTPARALGPFGAVVFSLPVALGFGVDSSHAFTSILLVIAAALAFWQLARLNMTLAWVWLIVFTAMRLVWWNASMFWVNTTLLPLGLLLLALFAASVRKPTIAKLALITLVLMCGLQQHLIAIVGVPILLVAVVAFLLRRQQYGSSPSRSISALGVIGAVIVLALVPYAVAEARTGLRNTRAMFGHVEAAVESTSTEGPRAALETLVVASDPALVLSDLSPVRRIVVGGVISLAAVALLAWRRLRVASRDRRELTDALLWLVATACVCIAGQALFFLLMARPIQGLHYTTLLAPWYPLPAAALVAALVPREGTSGTVVPAVLGIVAIALLAVRAPELADRYAERTAWNYRAIISALDGLCAGQAVGTVEGPGLVDDLTPAFDSVFRYAMKRGFSRCRYDQNADVLIVAPRTGTFDDSIEVGGGRFVRDTVVPPGIARYRAH